jgi:hypothetical protein
LNRRYLVGSVPEEFGKETAHSVERSAVRISCAGMNAKINDEASTGQTESAESPETIDERRGEPSNHRHEEKDVDVFSLFTIVFLLFLSCVIIFLVVSGMMLYFKAHEPAKTSGQANLPVTRAGEFPKPRLEVKGSADLARLRAAEEADLNSYGWVDRSAGTVRIPIDRAMQLLLERGLPDVGGGQTPLSLMQARPAETATPPRL